MKKRRREVGSLQPRKSGLHEGGGSSIVEHTALNSQHTSGWLVVLVGSAVSGPLALLTRSRLSATVHPGTRPRQQAELISLGQANVNKQKLSVASSSLPSSWW